MVGLIRYIHPKYQSTINHFWDEHDVYFYRAVVCVHCVTSMCYFICQCRYFHKLFLAPPPLHPQHCRLRLHKVRAVAP